MNVQFLAKLLVGDIVGPRSIAVPTPGHSRRDRGTTITFDPAAPDGFLVHSFNGGDPIEIENIVRSALGRPAYGSARKVARWDRSPTQSLAIAMANWKRVEAHQLTDAASVHSWGTLCGGTSLIFEFRRRNSARAVLGSTRRSATSRLSLNSYSDVPWEILGEFCDRGSGADNDRPELHKALAMVRKTGAELLVSKLARLSRKVSMISTVMDDRKVKIRVASMPHADKFQLHIYAALAEQERDFISKRTKAALAAAKERGVRLGGYRAGSLDSRIAALKATADADAQRVIGIIKPMRDVGMSFRAIAAELDRQGIKTPRDGSCTAMQVRNTLRRTAEPDSARAAQHETDVRAGGIIFAAIEASKRIKARQTGRVDPLPNEGGTGPMRKPGRR